MNSRIGHILTWDYMKQISRFYIIGQYRQKHSGLTVYVLGSWNAETKRFLELREDSYQFHSGKASISKAPFVMPEGVKAMSRAFRIMRLFQLVHKRIRAVAVGMVEIEAVSFHRSAFDIAARHGFAFRESESEILFGNPEIKKQRLALQAKLVDMLIGELTSAGILQWEAVTV